MLFSAIDLNSSLLKTFSNGSELGSILKYCVGETSLAPSCSFFEP